MASYFVKLEEHDHESLPSPPKTSAAVLVNIFLLFLVVPILKGIRPQSAQVFDHAWLESHFDGWCANASRQILEFYSTSTDSKRSGLTPPRSTPTPSTCPLARPLLAGDVPHTDNPQGGAPTRLRRGGGPHQRGARIRRTAGPQGRAGSDIRSAELDLVLVDSRVYPIQEPVPAERPYVDHQVEVE